MAADGEAAPQENGTKLTAAQKRKLKAKQRKQNKKAERCARAGRCDRGPRSIAAAGAAAGPPQPFLMRPSQLARAHLLFMPQGGAGCHSAG